MIDSTAMQIYAILTAILLLAQAGSTPQKHACPTPIPATDAKYSPGQVWNYKTRSDESASTVTILRVESLPKAGVVIHVRIDGIRLKNCSGGPSPTVIQHAPFSRDAFDKSVTQLVRSNAPVPDYEAGYEDWVVHCGGVYTITLAEMLNVDEATFNSGSGCNS